MPPLVEWRLQFRQKYHLLFIRATRLLFRSHWRIMIYLSAEDESKRIFIYINIMIKINIFFNGDVTIIIHIQIRTNI